MLDASSDSGPVPAGFTVRHPDWSDLDDVAALFAAVSLERVGAVTVRPGDLRVRWLELAGFDDALVVEHPPSGSLVVAYVELHADLDPWTGDLDLYVDGRVHPGFTHQGLASFLLARSEDGARRVARASSRATATLRTTVVDGDDSARRFFLTRGFTPVRHLLELRLDLHAPPPAPDWPPGVACRTFRPGEDEQAAWRVHEEAFADVATHLPLTFDEWLESRLRPDFDPELAFLAVADGVVVGTAVCRAGSEAAPEDGWVGDLGVVPAWRRHGIGMALLRTAFAAFRSRGLTGAALEVDDVTLDGAVALYRRAGMRVIHRTDVLERHLDLTA